MTRRTRLGLAWALMLLALAGCTPESNPDGSGGSGGEDMGPESDQDVVDRGTEADEGTAPDEGTEPDEGIGFDDGVEPEDAGCTPTAETCDGTDEDCDGTVDEETGGAACETGRPGVCNAGVEACVDGAVVCEAAAEPGAEVCDGLDNDCNGEADDVEGAGEACSAGLGACAADGVMACDADSGELACDAAVGEAGDEVCNGEDDDCDGEADEALGGGPCETGEPGACGAGTLACQGGEPVCVATAEPGEEVCDGVDNDCDGEVDDVAGLGVACTAGVGACAANGVVVCTPDGPACDAVAGEPQPELCDGADSDCNGVIDDVAGAGEPCSVGLGACAVDGVVACAEGGLQCDAVAGAPTDEVCDDVDNDCNGEIDDVEGVGEACTAGVGACAADGVVVCTADGPACDAVPGEGGPEVCGDGIDNDCNGAIDDDPRCNDEVCDNGADDDADLLTDCEDPDCSDFPGCQPPPDEVCDNGADDDADLLTDCEDPDCSDFPGCIGGPEQCAVTGDEDGNGVADCDDAACAGHPLCVTTPIAEPDGAILLSGSIDAGDAVWARPTAACGDEPAPDLHPYELLRIVNDSAEPRYVGIQARYAGGVDGDGYLHVYTAPFDPADRAGCLVGDDDGPGGTADSELDQVAIGPGQVLVLVVSTYYGASSPNDRFIGDYTVEVTTRVAEDCALAGDEDQNGLADCDDPACDGVAGCDVVAIPRPGRQVRLNGDIDAEDPEWDRPGENCAAGDGGLHPYEVLRIVNDTGAPRLINIEALYAGIDTDGYLHVFTDPFDPAVLDGCIVGDDDGNRGNANSQIFDQRIERGQVLTIVVSTYYGEAHPDIRYIGPFDVLITTQQTPIEDCAELGDEDGNGLAECDDPACAVDPFCRGEECDVPGDEDQNGLADCADAACADHPFCNPEACAIPGDEDGNGLADCDDPACAGEPSCRVEACAVPGDEDQNGLADCDDPACADHPFCNPEACAVPGDEDQNGLADCDDPACVVHPACVDQVPIAFPGGRRALDGALDEGDPTWARPDAACVAEGADQHPYEAFRIVNETGAAQTLDLLAAWSGGVEGDGYLHVYRAPFDPLALDGCVIGDDDGPGGRDDSLIEGVEIAPGEVLVVVASSYYGDDAGNNRHIGDYTIEVTTRGAAPTPIAAPGQSLALAGVIDGADPTWERPSAECIAEPGNQHPFEYYPIVNDSGADQVLDLRASYLGGVDGDGFLHVFADPFDPYDLLMCVAGDDDGPGGTADSEIQGVPIAAGEVLWVIVSTYYGDDSVNDRYIGDFGLTISTR